MPNGTTYSADPRERPLYSVYEAAHFIGRPPATIRSWIKERTYPNGTVAQPIIKIPDEYDGRMSFNNLVEAHVLAALRRFHGVRMNAIRKAVAYAEHEMQVSNLLLRDELRTGLGEIFWETIFGYVNLSRSGQIAIRKIVERYLSRVERDMSRLPMRLYPLIEAAPESRSVVIDPRVSFGQPTVDGSGVPTAIIVQLIDAGEEMEGVAHEFDLSIDQVSDAIVYEQAA